MKMTEENCFPDTNTFVENYNRISTSGPVPKHWLGLSYIILEEYVLDINFDETDMKIKSDKSPKRDE